MLEFNIRVLLKLCYFQWRASLCTGERSWNYRTSARALRRWAKQQTERSAR